MKKEKRECVLKLSDFHVPFHDMSAVQAALQFIKYTKPSMIFLDELVDFWALSKFEKDPDRGHDLEVEVEMATNILNMIRNTAPLNCEINMLESNHDRRLRKYILRNADAFKGIAGLKLEKMLELEKFKIRYYKDYIYKDILFKHGSLVRKESSATARAEMQREGMSGVSGHTHRLGITFKRLRGGEYCWIEGGCLCQIDDVDYIDGIADWQQGISGFFFKEDGRRFAPVIIPIVKGEIFYDGYMFGGDNGKK